MTYTIKEAFFTLQGEGAQTGRAAVFCRFAGCNLWSGRESDRAAAACNFCDTDFVGADGEGGGRFKSAAALAAHLRTIWASETTSVDRFVVLTGGEPTLQLDPPLVTALKSEGFELAVESNGTRPVPDGVDWVCISPKPNSEIVQRSGAELKLIYPQPDLRPEQFTDWGFKHFFIQPMDGPSREANTAQALDFCRRNPQWRLSLQTHKLLGIP